MAFTITSYTPMTGPVSGGTLCTVTGTGLTVVDAVLVDNVEATIVGTPGATTLQFRTPPGSAGTATVTLIDTGADEAHNAADFTYTAVTADEGLQNTRAGKFRLDVRHVGDSTWTHVRAATTTQRAVTTSTEDDSDTDSGFDGADYPTGRKTNITGTVKRGKGVVSGTYDPGQEIIRLAADSVTLIEFRYFDRTGGPEAFEGTAYAQWAPQGGNQTADKANFTLNQQGPATVITNPVLADPTLAAPYAVTSA